MRNDEKDSVLRGLDSIKVHINCRKQYARIDRIKPDEITNNSEVPIKSPIKAQLRSARPLFNFKLTCFFCAENIDDDFLKIKNKNPQINVVKYLMFEVLLCVAVYYKWR